MGQRVRREIEVEQILLPAQNLLLRILRRVHGNEVVVRIVCAAEEALLPDGAHLALLLSNRQRAVQRVDQPATPTQGTHTIRPTYRIQRASLDQRLDCATGEILAISAGKEIGERGERPTLGARLHNLVDGTRPNATN